MKKLSLLITLFAVTLTSSAVYAQFTQAQMIQEWQRAKAYTNEYLEVMPADGYAFKPAPDIRSFAQQMLHLAEVNYQLGSAAGGLAIPGGMESPEKTVPPTKGDVIRTVLDSYNFVIGSLQGMTDAKLLEKAKADGHELTRGIIFAKAFEHQTHHRGQCGIYLRLKGVVPPPERLF